MTALCRIIVSVTTAKHPVVILNHLKALVDRLKPNKIEVRKLGLKSYLSTVEIKSQDVDSSTTK